MMRTTARMMMMPMTMTAIIAPELWISICSLDFVRNVVFEGTVVMGTGEADELIFSNNQTDFSVVSAQVLSRWTLSNVEISPPVS